MSVLISVIVPVYNVAPYVIQCLESISHQTYETIEIIVVEDGSTDNSRDLVLEYAKKDARVRVLCQTNQGLSCARNNGFAQSRGDYIVFVDSDDTIHSTMLETMLDGFAEGIDMVETQVYFSYEDKPPIVKPYQTRDDINGVDLQTDSKALLYLSVTAHSKMYRRALLAGVSFPDGIVHEDVYFTSLLYPRLRGIRKLHTGGYFHLQRSDSITNTYNERIYDMLAVHQRIWTYYQEEPDCFKRYYHMLQRNAVRMLVISTIGRKMSCMKPQYRAGRKEQYEKIRHFIQTYYGDYRKNPYLSVAEKTTARCLLSSFDAARAAMPLIGRIKR